MTNRPHWSENRPFLCAHRHCWNLQLTLEKGCGSEVTKPGQHMWASFFLLISALLLYKSRTCCTVSIHGKLSASSTITVHFPTFINGTRVAKTAGRPELACGSAFGQTETNWECWPDPLYSIIAILDMGSWIFLQLLWWNFHPERFQTTGLKLVATRKHLTRRRWQFNL